MVEFFRTGFFPWPTNQKTMVILWFLVIQPWPGSVRKEFLEVPVHGFMFFHVISKCVYLYKYIIIIYIYIFADIWFISHGYV